MKPLIAPGIRRAACAHTLGALLLPLLLLMLLTALLGSSRSAAAASPAQEPDAAPATPLDAALALTLTVAPSDSCSPEAAPLADTITIAQGRPVFLCYTAHNSGDVTFTRHLLSDAGFTNVTEIVQDLPPNGVLNRTIPVTPTASTTFVGVWAAITGTLQIQANDSVQITVLNPALTVVQTLGRTPGECGTDRNLVIPSTTAAHVCLTLTNRGDVELVTHEISVPTLGITGTVSSFALPPGETVRITTDNAASFGLPSLSVNATTPISFTARVLSRTSQGFSALSRSDAALRIGSSTATAAGFVHTAESCRNVSTTSLSLVKGTLFYYCLQLTNTGSVPLERHRLSITAPARGGEFSYALAPGATLVITNGVLTALGLEPLFGPYTTTATLNNTFALTSTNAAGFRTLTSAAASITALDPTPTLTPTPTPIPPTPTFTPIPTSTPFPSPTPWPTIPTPTPFPTPIPPTPTFTRSYELSNLATPTPNPEQAAALIPPPPPVDPLLTTPDPNAALPAAPFDSTLPQPESPLIGAGELAPGAPLTVEAALPLAPIETPSATPTLTPTPTPSHTPSHTPQPSATPTPTATPTATQRPIVYPTPAPPLDVVGLFGRVLDATLSAAGLLFVMVAAIAFFGVAGAVAGMGFLRAGRHRYELFELEPVDDGDELSAPPPGRASARSSARAADSPPNPADHWPTSLP